MCTNVLISVLTETRCNDLHVRIPYIVHGFGTNIKIPRVVSFVFQALTSVRGYRMKSVEKDLVEID